MCVCILLFFFVYILYTPNFAQCGIIRKNYRIEKTMLPTILNTNSIQKKKKWFERISLEISHTKIIIKTNAERLGLDVTKHF